MITKTDPTRYFSEPVGLYPWVAGCALIGKEPLAWNLAWASHELTPKRHPDPKFTVLVHMTACTVLASGEQDLLRLAPEHLLLRSKLRLPPQAFLMWLLRFKHVLKLPLFEAYGPEWLQTVRKRCDGWQDPTVTDTYVGDISQAKELLSRF